MKRFLLLFFATETVQLQTTNLDPLALPFIGQQSDTMYINVLPQDIEAIDEQGFLDSLIPSDDNLFMLDEQKFQRVLDNLKTIHQ